MTGVLCTSPLHNGVFCRDKVLSFFKNKSSEPVKYEKVNRSYTCCHVAGFHTGIFVRGDFLEQP